MTELPPVPGSGPSGRRAEFRNRAGRVGLSILDQGLLSGASFLLGVFAARWLAPQEFGAFAVAFSIHLFVLGLYSAFVTEPLRVLVWRQGGAVQDYRRAVSWLQVCASVFAAGVLALVALVLHASGSVVAPAVLVLAAFAPATFGLHYRRTGCYLRGRPAAALRISATYAIALIAGATAVWLFAPAKAGSVVLVTGIASFVAAMAAGLPQLQRPVPSRPAWIDLQLVLREHWQFGRWLAASSVSYWLGAAAYLPLSAGLVSLEAAAAMRAVQTLFQPLEQVMQSLGMLLLPAVARRRPSGGARLVRTLARRISALYAAVALLYAALLWPAADWVLNRIYAGRYDDYQWLVPVLAVSAILASATYGLVIGMNVIERTDAVFVSRGAGAAASLVLGIPLLLHWQLAGAAAAVVLSSAAVFLAAVYFHVSIRVTDSAAVR